MASRLLVIAFIAGTGVGAAKTVDRVVASVGNLAITENDVENEYHFELFLEGRTPNGKAPAATRKVVLNRLISQQLLIEELKNSGAKIQVSRKNAEDVLWQIRKRFPAPKSYEAAVHLLGMNEAQILERLELYEQTLRMIDARFRALAGPSPDEIAMYYKNTFRPEYQHLHAAPPPSEKQVADQIREILIQQKINHLLDDWLNEMRATHQVRIHTF